MEIEWASNLQIEKNLLVIREEKVKEFIKLTEKENDDFSKDIIELIEINDYGKDDLISKMKRLIKAHRNERDKLAGDKLTGITITHRVNTIT